MAGNSNSGRKRREGVERYAYGGIVYPTLTAVCACGAAKHPSAKTCLKCNCNARKQLRPKPCAECGRQYQPKSSKSVCCGIDCGKAWSRRISKAKARPADAALERLREKRRILGQRRRAAGYSSKGQWRVVCERDGWVCWICGCDIDPTIKAPHRMAGSADHVVSMKHGGSHELDNLRAAHISCNARRGAGKFTPQAVAWPA